MNSSNRLAIGLGLSFFSWFSLAVTGQISDGNYDFNWESPGIHSPENGRPLASISTVTLGAYNVQNLFESDGSIDSGRLPSLPDYLFSRAGQELKPLKKVKGVAKAIGEIGYDILVVEEVEDIKALQVLNAEFLDGAYTPYLLEGNDPRGIDVGFLIKKDLPLYVEHRTHKFETWNDPTQDGKEVKLFSRDLPALILTEQKGKDAALVLFGTHFKSKISRPKDPESKILRKAQAERASLLVAAYQKEFGSQTPILFAGDFNGDVDKEAEFVALKSVAKLEDSFNDVLPPLQGDARVTHTYHPQGQPPVWSHLDAVMVNAAARPMLHRAYAYRYKDTEGKPWPLPKTYYQASQNPSDHFPVVAQFDFQKMLAAN